MKTTLCLILILLTGFCLVQAAVEIPADDPNIQYFGRWDFSDPLAPSHSWPGVYIYAEFQGTSIGVKLNDHFCYYNVFIDGVLRPVFHPSVNGLTTYTLASGLSDGVHTILLHKRNETTWAKFSFHGFILDDGKTLLPPPAKPERKIEFVGDSFTSASGNEYDKPDKPANDAPLTNIYEGFGPITARHFGAQYMMTSRSGFGMVMDWQGSTVNNIPDCFDQTHTYTATPPWDFQQWIPNLVVIGLGLNDYSGFGGWNGPVSETNRNLYKTRYHQFIATLRDVYPGVKILAAAPHVDWLQQVIAEIVTEENAAGNNDVYYTYYHYYEGGYVYEGHPSVATHRKIADELIAAIEKFDAWTPYDDQQPPVFTRTPASPFTAYATAVPVQFQTDSYAVVKYSEHDKPWEQMEHTFQKTGQRTHLDTLHGDHGKTHTFYFRAADVRGNQMQASAVVTFTIDTTKVLRKWQDQGFDDSNWKSGPTSIGYGTTSSLKTVCAPVITAYFRHPFQVTDVSDITGMGFFVRGRDAAVVYLNGHEIRRINFNAGDAIAYETTPVKTMPMNEMTVINAGNGLGYIRNGENLFAVEMHAYDAGFSGLVFDAQLIDNKNTIYFKLGSEWKYDDGGAEPSPQIQDKATGVAIAPDMQLPQTPRLEQNYPNPFNARTRITFSLPHPARVTLQVFSILGAEVARLVDARLPAGEHSVSWHASVCSTGLYYLVLTTDKNKFVQKALLIK